MLLGFCLVAAPSQAVLGQGGGGMAVVLVDVDGLPRVADPLVADGAGRKVAAVNDVGGEDALLGLVLVLFWWSRGVSRRLSAYAGNLKRADWKRGRR